MEKKLDLIASVWATGGHAEETHVPSAMCPANRAQDGEETAVCVCRNERGQYYVPRCPHYQGLKKVKRKGKDERKVLCALAE